MKVFSTRMIGFMAMSWMFFVGTASAQCVTTYPYFQNFDTGASGWTSTPTGPNGWTLGTPAKPVINAPFSAPNCWITGFTTGNYSSNRNAYVTSPCFDFTNLTRPAIAMKIFYECEYSFDGAAFFSSIDNGVTWQRVGGYLDPVGWYNDNTINGGIAGGPGGQPIGWTGATDNGTGSITWLTAQHTLFNLAGQPIVKFRMYFDSDNGPTSGNDDGFAFDDILIADVPDISLGPDIQMCFADTATLLPGCNGNCTFKWSTNPYDTLSSLTVVKTGNYWVQVVDTNGFILRDTVHVTVSPTFVNLGPDRIICPGDTLNLDSGNPWALTHTWQPNNIQSQTLKVSSSGKYKVTVTDSYGCVEIDSINVIVDYVPPVELGNDTTICIGQSIVLDAGAGNPGTTYQWNFGTASTQTITISAPATYKVDITTQANCTTSDSITIGVSLSPVVDLGPDRTVCGSYVLNANNTGSNFLWSTGDITQTITLIQGGTFSVKVTNPFGCFDSDTVSVAAGVVPIVNLGPNKVVCNNSPVSLDAGNPGAHYFWSNGDTTRAIQVTNGGTYSVSVTNAGGCTGHDTIDVVRSNLFVNLGNNRTICSDDPTTLVAGPAGPSYIWSNGGTGSSITISAGGTFSVIATDGTGCVARDTVSITAYPSFNPDFSVTGSLQLYNSLQFNNLSTGNTTSWFWDFGDGVTSNLKNPQHTYQAFGNFTVLMRATDGPCVRTVTKNITIELFTSLEEALGLNLQVYPNPAEDDFTVAYQVEKVVPMEISLIDLAGKTLLRESLIPNHEGEVVFNVTQLPAGLYLVRLQVEAGNIFRKISIR